MNMELESARFLDAKCSLMELKLKNRKGKEKTVQLIAPANYEKGQNAYFDKVLEKYDIEEMVRKTKLAADQIRKRRAYNEEKGKSSSKQQMHNDLFKEKLEFLNKEIMQESTPEQRRAIRKANTPEKLTMVKYEIIREYAQQKEISVFQAILDLDNTNDEE
mgnify:CR=1 FL=1